MDDQLETLEEKTNIWTSVTPFSKYLALTLMISLPFIGGWVGYNLAPEKIVEVEKIVTGESTEILKELEVRTGDIPDGWKTYTDEEYGFEISYPPDWNEPLGFDDGGGVNRLSIDNLPSDFVAGGCCFGLTINDQTGYGQYIPTGDDLLSDKMTILDGVSVREVDEVTHFGGDARTTYIQVKGRDLAFVRHTDDPVVEIIVSTFRFLSPE